MSKIIVTGEIGVGKSTLVKNVLSPASQQFDRRDNYPASHCFAGFEILTGFQTKKIFRNNIIIGFDLEEISGESQTFAHVDFIDHKKFSTYGVKLNVFENFGVEVLKRCEKSKSFLLIDELGKMERTASEFSTRIKNIIISKEQFLIVIQKRALDFWLSECNINKKNNITIFEVTRENREHLIEKIRKEL